MASGSTDSAGAGGEDRLMIRRVSSGLSLAGPTFVTVYSSMWNALNDLALDPHPEVAAMAKYIVDMVKKKVSLPL